MWINSFFPFMQLHPMSAKKLARYENDLEFQNIFFRLFNICLNTFEYENLPSTCNQRYFETALILEGIAAIVNDPELGLLSLRCSRIPERYNVYGETDKVFGYGWNGFIREYSAYMPGTDYTDVNAVVCRDNPVTYPYLSLLIQQANRLCQSIRTIDVTSKKLKTPYYITCEESQKQAVEKTLRTIDENVDAVISSKSLSPDSFQVLPTRVEPEILTKQWENFNNIYGYTKEILGVENIVNQDKTERLLTDEVNGNKTSTHINIDFRLKEREKFCEYVKEVFGIDLKVHINEQYVTKYESTMEIEEPELEVDLDERLS
ncbi:MAG: hypothetical protein NC131_11545 [Roseburia sp.]|nr:hypothetical protein [Roseburia sp.]